MRVCPRPSLRSFLAICTLLAGLPGTLARAHAQAYTARPKLIVMLVLDQFRGDYLDRFRDDFRTPMGFNLFLRSGAHFTDCYYDYANTMTAPGHATLGTGAYTDGHGISLNEWWDLSRSASHAVSSVDDERYQILGGSTANEVGVSPRSELASTLGDELVLATGGKARLYGISLKDRAAVLISGHASQGAFWLDHATGHFVSSTYWGPKLPPWVEAFNASGRAEQAQREAGAAAGRFYDQVGATPASVSYLLDFAQHLVTAESLGRHEVTDMLTISISSTDILGHRVGPDSPEQRALIGATDKHLNDFFIWLDKNVDGGMANVWVSLSADHGVGPTAETGEREGMPSAVFSVGKINAALDRRLNDRFSPGKNVRYMLSSDMPYLELDPRAFAAGKVSEADAEQAVVELLPEAVASTAASGSVTAAGRPREQAAFRAAYTRVQIAAGQVAATEAGRLVLHSYSPNGGWYVMVVPGIYQLSGASGTTHYTPFSYDRHVPLDLYGSAFLPGTYHGRVGPVDIAATFASLLRINQPSASVGRVLTEALRPEARPVPLAPQRQPR